MTESALAARAKIRPPCTLKHRVRQEYNSLLVNALNRIFKSNLSLNNWIISNGCLQNWTFHAFEILYPVLENATGQKGTQGNKGNKAAGHPRKQSTGATGETRQQGNRATRETKLEGKGATRKTTQNGQQGNQRNKAKSTQRLTRQQRQQGNRATPGCKDPSL